MLSCVLVLKMVRVARMAMYAVMSGMISTDSRYESEGAYGLQSLLQDNNRAGGFRSSHTFAFILHAYDDPNMMRIGIDNTGHRLSSSSTKITVQTDVVIVLEKLWLHFQHTVPTTIHSVCCGSQPCWQHARHQT